MDEEFSCLLTNNTWSYIKRSDITSSKVISSKWLYKMKENLISGFEQQYGIDDGETFAPVPKLATIRLVPKMATIRLLFALTIRFDLNRVGPRETGHHRVTGQGCFWRFSALVRPFELLFA